ncbi:MAG: Glycerol-3-phosphate acyltransferase [Moraxellaceae bacterium]|jgi:glycerol-3-phosphate acyltransferase PlsY|nr:Glycerol-3-phosphate acyltransferase [Moraxellaceae bacterium]
MPPELIATGMLIFAYLLGSVSTAIIVCRLLGLPDPRTEGSHNPGATNVLRLGGKGPAILTLLGDMLKGVVPVLIAQHVLQLSAPWLAGVGFAAFLGHLFPVFFRFEGGKGVATAMGVLLALHWPLGLAVIGIWIVAFAPTRISSLGSIIGFAAAPLLCAWMAPALVIGVTPMSIVLLVRHRPNIQALLRGEERKFGQKKPDVPGEPQS